jgi:16S rRNA processing protein RimM
MDADDELVRIGRVVKPHGIRGELVVEPSGDTLAGMSAGDSIHIGSDVYVIAGLRPHQGRILVGVEGVPDRNAAELLRGAAVCIASADLPGLEDGEWYAGDLLGWTVADRVHGELGVVTAVVPAPAHDYLQVGKSQLIPMVRDWLDRLDPEARRICLRLPRGLLSEAD